MKFFAVTLLALLFSSALAVAHTTEAEVKLPERMNLQAERLRWVEEKPRLHLEISLSEKSVRGFSFSTRNQSEESYRSGLRPFVGVLGLYEVSSGVSARFGGEVGFLSRTGVLEGMGGMLSSKQELYWVNAPLGGEYVLWNSQSAFPWIAVDLKPGFVLEEQTMLGGSQTHFILSVEESIGFSIAFIDQTQLRLRGFLGQNWVGTSKAQWVGGGLSLKL